MVEMKLIRWPIFHVTMLQLLRLLALARVGATPPPP